MISRIRRVLCVLVAGAAVGVPSAAGCVAYAGEGSLPPSASQLAPMPEGIVLDGFTVSRLPRGIGGKVSNFEYEWEDVSFHTQVW